MSLFRRWAAAGAVLLAAALPAGAAETNVAVAANFTDAAKEIGQAFAAKTGHKAVFSFGSSGQLLTQIAQQAPFQVFLSADRERPKKAVDDGLALPESLFTYAIGKLVLFTVQPGLTAGEAALREGRFDKLAIANPATAPYGAAAVETLKKLGVHDALAPKLVQGNNIGQTYQFVETGNAAFGFVALSQVIASDKGSRWVVPAELYTPIRQDAVLLKSGADSEAAKAFVAFLKGPEALAVIEKFGYVSGN